VLCAGTAVEGTAGVLVAVQAARSTATHLTETEQIQRITATASRA
jgi:hypothetical protein